MDTLIQEMMRWIHNSDKKLIIGISGHGAAGKTTFADAGHMAIRKARTGKKNEGRNQVQV